MSVGGSPMVLSSSHRSPTKLIAVIAVVATATITAGGFYVRATGASKGSAERLARIVGAHRVTRARMTGGFAYAKCEADSVTDRVVRGLSCRSPARSTWSSAEKLGSFAQELLGTPDSTRSHVAGIWELVWGRTDEALADLREAARRAPKDARTLNDLGVAFTAYAAEHDDPSALVDAFVAIDSAMRADSTIEEVRFNHALLLEQLQLRIPALAAWHRYLARDVSSRWADEAVQHTTALALPDSPASPREWRNAGADSRTLTRLISRDRAGAREFAQRELGAWARAVQGDDTAEAAGHLSAARVVANEFRDQTGDALLADGIAVIDRALRENNGLRLKQLADGHAALTLGIDSLRALAVGPTALAAARRQLGSAASPMAFLALLFQARSRVNFAKDSSLVWLTSIRDSAPAAYTSLRMSAVQYIGYINDRKLDYVHGIAAYDSALAENRDINDPELTIRTAAWLSEPQGILRGREAAWRTLYAALVATHDITISPASRFTAFDYAMQATKSEAPRLALRYAAEAIRYARLQKGSPSTAYALRDRAEILTRLGQDSRARVDIDSARAAARPINNSKLNADIDLTGAYVTMHSEPAKAEAELRGVINEYVHGEIKDERGLSLAYLYLAQARAAAGNIDLARVAFDSATMLMQRTRASLSNLSDRGAFLDAARSVIDQILAFHVAHNSRDAFEFFEGNRSRVLLDQLSSGVSPAAPRLTLPELQRHLTKDDLILSYAVLPKQLFVWIIGRDRFEQRPIAMNAYELETLVTKFRESVRTAAGEPDSLLGGRLYRMLVDSTNTLGAKNLFVIPDRSLHFLPFAALRNPATRRLLVLDRTVSYEPSATLLLSSLSVTPRSVSQASRILAIGNPAFDTTAFRLRKLPGAVSEAWRIASWYHQNALIEREATDVALERMAPQADVIHFAGHAIVGRDAPQLSHLVLASDGQSDGVVFSTEIAGWRLNRTRVVVLSACSTADGKLSSTEGASSLARAFFAAGVPSVISSLWAVDDSDPASFFLFFHRRLTEGQSPAAALQEAQIKWLNDGGRTRPARSWAGFQLFGHS